MELTISGIPVRGMEIDARTGCAHYRSELDIIAVKFNCCRTYYSCFYCHELEADHPARIWPPAQFDEKAVLCGACGAELTIRQYLNCQAACPVCGARFNPGCALHYHLYFETSGWLISEPFERLTNVTEAERNKRGEKSAVIVERLVRAQLRATGGGRFDLGVRREVEIFQPWMLRLRGDLLVRSGAPASEVGSAYREAIAFAQVQDQVGPTTVHNAFRSNRRGPR